MRRTSLVSIYFLSLFKLFLYEEYCFSSATLFIISIRKSILTNLGHLAAFISGIALLAAISHLTYRDCAWEFKTYVDSIYSLLHLSLSEELHTSLGETCDTTYAKMFYIFLLCVMKVIFITILVSNMLFALESMRKAEHKKRITVEENLKTEMDIRLAFRENHLTGPEREAVVEIQRGFAENRLLLL